MNYDEEYITDYDLGWDAAIEAAAKFMESRGVSASAFYAEQLRKLKK